MALTLPQGYLERRSQLYIRCLLFEGVQVLVGQPKHVLFAVVTLGKTLHSNMVTSTICNVHRPVSSVGRASDF